ncbi:GGDEF domain-containing protein [Petrocella sp. FN5]|uniref:GGDEF domain-containing protein n=1 Tax=Petrocella sp. FN5 TaxID=3032002 RepID=UPI0023DB919B|nr:GGDEF domain-containing protein [Petrocella sp. FN5]MDF1616097.1 GGDEF domain-containing protein [Petrocella sp. FN5]
MVSILDNTFDINLTLLGTLPTIIILLILIALYIVTTLFVQHLKYVGQAVLIECSILITLVFYLLLTHATSDLQIFNYSRLVYLSYNLLAVVIVGATSWMTKKKTIIPFIIAIFISTIIISLIFMNDTWFITRGVQYGSTPTAVKGPYFFIFQLYSISLALYVLVDFVLLYYRNKPMFKEIWLLYGAILLYLIHTTYISYIISNYPYSNPSLYRSTLLFATLKTIYTFKMIKETIVMRESYYQAYLYDDLTKLYSRNYALENLNHLLNAVHLKDHYLAIIDVDHFKIINDNYGHHKGDLVLKNLGEILKKQSAPSTLSGRLGGDEFLIIFKSMTREKVHKSLESILKDYNDMIAKMGIKMNEVRTGLSIGYVSLHEGMKSKDVLSMADSAMYQAKSNGKNTITFHPKDTNPHNITA